MTDKLRSLYVDLPNWEEPLNVDDFLVAVGLKKSNSVYHIAQSRAVPRKEKRVTRYYLKVLKTDLLTALMRDSDQKLMPIKWYSRSKK